MMPSRLRRSRKVAPPHGVAPLKGEAAYTSYHAFTCHARQTLAAIDEQNRLARLQDHPAHGASISSCPGIGSANACIKPQLAASIRPAASLVSAALWLADDR